MLHEVELVGDPAAPESESDEFLCGLCSLTFKSANGGRTHRAKVHGTSRGAFFRNLIVGTKCPACCIDFRSRLRVLHHLGQSGTGCAVLLEEGLVLNPSPAQVAAADLQDRAHRKRCCSNGVHELSGPPCIRPSDRSV